jgi:Stress responsive A/B Barrel Domain
MNFKNSFIHHVYFWLKDPNNAAHTAQLESALQKLAAVSTIKHYHIGKPAATSRGVIDNTYSLSWMLVFENASDQDSYQVDPIHLKFVEENSYLWERVIVYDSIDA